MNNPIIRDDLVLSKLLTKAYFMRVSHKMIIM